MTKPELIAKVAEKTGISKKTAELAINATLETVTESLSRSEKVSLIGFGTFEVRDRAARKARNPQTGEEIQVPAGKSPAFKAGKILKETCKLS